MADYRKMYALLCGTIDSVLDELKTIPCALPSADKLQRALWKAEEMYMTDEESNDVPC